MFSLKLTLNNVTRRILYDGNLHYDELVKLSQLLFSSLESDIEFTYKDDEGDLIRVSTDEELRAALSIQFLFNTELVKFNIRLKASPADGPKTVHHDVTCDECCMSPIVGVRYKCTNRQNYDLCESCEGKRRQPFPMIKISSQPRSSPRCGPFNSFVGKRGCPFRSNRSWRCGAKNEEMENFLKNIFKETPEKSAEKKETADLNKLDKDIMEAVMKESTNNTTATDSTEATKEAPANFKQFKPLVPEAAEPRPTAAPMVSDQWGRELKLMAEMGFTDETVIVPLLERIVGSPSEQPVSGDQLQRVVWQLLQRY